MYGTVARMKIKPGMEKQFKEFMTAETERKIPGMMKQYVYRMDKNPNEYYLVVMFKDRDSYVANADLPEMNSEYQRYRALLTEDPEWHDGEVVWSE